MVVDNLHVFGARGSPSETDTPLVVNAYRMLPGTAPFQEFKVVAGRRTKIVQLNSILDCSKTTLSASDQVGRKTFRRPSRSDRLHRLAFERNDQSYPLICIIF
jgi:hypothetical protein